MAASTIEELADDLDDSFQWRRLELHQIKSDLRGIRSTTFPPRDRMILRSAVVLLYAHWEGFVRDACQSYVDFVAVRRLPYKFLSEPLLRTAVAKLATEAASDPTATEKLASVIRDGGASRSNLPRRSLVDTKSNLRYSVTQGIFQSLGLPLGIIETRDKLIDHRLCDARNAVAHGKTSFPTKEDIIDLHEKILEMMEHVRTAVLNAASGKAYKVVET